MINLISDSSSFFDELFKGIPVGPDNAISIGVSTGKRIEFNRCNSIADAKRYGASFATRDIYVGLSTMGPVASGRGKSKDAKYITAIAVDIDCIDGGTHGDKPLPTKAEAIDLIDSLPVKPTFEIDTGGGFHVWWLLETAFRIETEPDRERIGKAIRAVNERIAKWCKSRGWKYEQLADLARILRVPGTLNCKTNPPKPVTVIRHDTPLRRYALEEIESQFGPIERSSEPVQRSAVTPNYEKAKRDCEEIEADDAGDGSNRLMRYLARAKRAGLDLQLSIELVRELEAEYPFSRDYSDSDIAARYSQCRAEAAKEKAGKADPRDIAREIVADNIVDGECTIRFSGSQPYRYRPELGCWKSLSDYELRAIVTNEMDRRYSHILSSHISSVIDHLRAMLTDSVAAPYWLSEGWPVNECFATKDAIVNLANVVNFGLPFSVPSTPRFFNDRATDYPFVLKDPGCPKWLEFLSTAFADDESRLALQMWFGYCLTADTSQQKILFLIGPKRSGKGVLAQVLTALIGSSNVCGPTLAGLATNFGLASLIGKSLGIIGDARLGRAVDQAVITERLLSISAGDLLTIDRKYAEPISTRLPTRLMILSNELPRLTDASNALASRMLLIRTAKSFYGNEDTKLVDKLLAELPGILHWAIDGWARLSEQGAFIQPASGQNDAEQLRQLSSPLSAFIDERCDLSGEVETRDLFKVWGEWCFETNYPKGSLATFGRDLSTVEGVQRYRKSEPPRSYFYSGISIKPEFRKTNDSELFEALS